MEDEPIEEQRRKHSRTQKSRFLMFRQKTRKPSFRPLRMTRLKMTSSRKMSFWSNPS